MDKKRNQPGARKSASPNSLPPDRGAAGKRESDDARQAAESSRDWESEGGSRDPNIPESSSRGGALADSSEDEETRSVQ